MRPSNRPAIRSYAEAAAEFTRRTGIAMSEKYAQCCEDRALKKIRKALDGIDWCVGSDESAAAVGERDVRWCMGETA